MSLLGDTEILTESGWKRLDEFNGDIRVGGYDSDYSSIKWETATDLKQKRFEGSLHHLRYNKLSIDLTVTEDHNILFRDHKIKHNAARKVQARDFECCFSNKLLCSGNILQSTEEHMTYDDKVAVAVSLAKTQEFSIPENNIRYVKFLPKYIPEIARLQHILSNANIDYEKERIGKNVNANFTAAIPERMQRRLDWVNPTMRSYTWIDEFMHELYLWKRGGRIEDIEQCSFATGSNTDAACIHTLCAIGGFRCHRTTLSGVMKHWFVLHKTDENSTHFVERTLIPYGGQVYSVLVPSGNIVIKQNNCVHIVGC